MSGRLSACGVPGWPSPRQGGRVQPSRSWRPLAAVTALVAVVGAAVLGGCHGGWPDPAAARAEDRLPVLSSELDGVTIPPNLAPPYFRVREPGTEFVVEFVAGGGGGFRGRCPQGACRWDADAWRALLAANCDADVGIQVSVRQSAGQWVRYRPLVLHVAAEPIDPWIVYRLLVPNTQQALVHGIYQRSLESFATERLIAPREGGNQCFNCHTFHQHDPSRFFFHVRGRHAGTVLVTGGKVSKVDLLAEPLYRPMSYAAWHPDGRHIVGSVNQYAGFFTSAERLYYSHTVDTRGDLVVYDVERNELSTAPAVFGPDYVETHPAFAADGRSIFYARARSWPLWTRADLDQLRADLVRVDYDVETGRWGTPAIVLPCASRGRSASFPQPSACGRWLLHVQADRGTYPITEPSSDLQLLDLTTGQSRALDELNSGRAESNPRWSSNGRWIGFLSNRDDGRSAVPYYAYFSPDGQVGRPFVLPQEDPDFYQTFMDTYNVMELVSGPVPVGRFQLGQALQAPAAAARLANAVGLDALTRATATGPDVPGSRGSH